jgi:hypothetical protein
MMRFYFLAMFAMLTVALASDCSHSNRSSAPETVVSPERSC